MSYPTLNSPPITREFTPTLLDVANEALGLCGRPVIKDLEENSFEAIQIRAALPKAINWAAMERDWSFNRTVHELNQIEPSNPHEWGLEEDWVKYGWLTPGIIRVIKAIDGPNVYSTYFIDHDRSFWLKGSHNSKTIRVVGLLDIALSDIRLRADVGDETNRLEFISVAAYYLAQFIAGAILNNPGAGQAIKSAMAPMISRILAAKGPLPTRIPVK